MDTHFTATSSFFMNVTGSMAINQEHYIGVSTSGNKDNVMIKSLRCSVEVIEPTYGLGTNEPTLRFRWSVEYVNWNRSKGAWGVRSNYQEIDNEYVNRILGNNKRIDLQHDLLAKLDSKLLNGVKAIDNYDARLAK